MSNELQAAEDVNLGCHVVGAVVSSPLSLLFSRCAGLGVADNSWRPGGQGAEVREWENVCLNGKKTFRIDQASL